MKNKSYSGPIAGLEESGGIGVSDELADAIRALAPATASATEKAFIASEAALTYANDITGGSGPRRIKFSMTVTASIIGVGLRSVERARKVMERGSDELREACRRGDVSLYAAEAIIRASVDKSQHVKYVERLAAGCAYSDAVRGRAAGAKARTISRSATNSPAAIKSAAAAVDQLVYSLSRLDLGAESIRVSRVITTLREAISLL